MKNENIGYVTLDYSLYPGKDLYSDGNIEDELLNIVQTYEEEQFGKIIKEKKDWAILYHLSQVRQNIISWFPFTKEQKVLEIGSGCGAITGALADQVGQVDCVELSRKRSLINANRNKKHNNITIKVGNFEEIEPHLDKDYDVITLIGVWEYSALYLNAEKPFEKFLDLLKKHIKTDGKIIIAIENKFGLKYWAGCREDHTGLFFEGVEGYTNSNGAVTFGKNTLEKMFENSGYSTQFYYPYPDYKLPLRIYSDDYLPKQNELRMNACNLDTDRLILFNDDEVFDSIIEEEMFPFFSNSFLIVLENKEYEHKNEVIYSLYKNQGQNCFRVYKDIEIDDRGTKKVRLSALNKEAVAHISRIYDKYKKTEEDGGWSNIHFQKCKKDDTSLLWEIPSGEKAIEKFRELLDENKREEVEKLLMALIRGICSQEQQEFVATKEFRKIFGEYDLSGKALDGFCFNFNLNNMSYNKGVWTVFCSEWSFDFPIPTNYIIYRILRKQLAGLNNRTDLEDLFAFTEEEKIIYEKMEQNFQKYIMGDGELIEKSSIIKPKHDIKEGMFTEKAVKLYKDYGQGFSEDNVDVYSYYSSQDICLEIKIPEKVKAIRIDPMEQRGIVHLKRIEVHTEEGIFVPEFTVNGQEIEKGYYVFDTNDPWFLLEKLHEKMSELYMTFDLTELPADIVSLYNKGRNDKETGGMQEGGIGKRIGKLFR